MDAGECYALPLCKHMGTVHKQPGRPFWFCAFTMFDKEEGTNRRVFRSTKTRDKKQADEICQAWSRAAKLGRKDKLNRKAADDAIERAVEDVVSASERNRIGETFARKIVGRGISDIYRKANLESFDTVTTKSW
ncbi:MAG: hypothetical protein M3Q46_12915, partial [Verrucomicrobiota bacterium]|nr:hypothetical protein [Verrucomicrobiota bacterium]